MRDNLETLKLKVSDQSIYRRHYKKRDGRDLFLYGYAPHIAPPLEEELSELTKGGELRHHPLRDEWNIYAAHRQNRTFQPSVTKDPLAPSKIGQKPTEIPFKNFELAIFENKFTSLHPNASSPTSLPELNSERASGRCEVVVYGPQQTGNLHSIGQEKRQLLVASWIDRYVTLYSEGHQFVLPFENRGSEVGVTLDHPHGQIYAFPFIPKVQKQAIQAFSNGYDLCHSLESFRANYGIVSTGDIDAFCPPFARFPYEVWLAPRIRRAGLWNFNDTERAGFATLIGDITRRYDEYFQRPTPYMLSLHASPLGAENIFHFTAQFYPLLRSPTRIKYLASVEQSTGVFTVDVLPEAAAQILRGL